jgi:hypothetical protein
MKLTILIAAAAVSVVITLLYFGIQFYSQPTTPIQGVIDEKIFVTSTSGFIDNTPYYTSITTLTIKTANSTYEYSQSFYGSIMIDPLSGYYKGDNVTLYVTKDNDVLGISKTGEQ